MTAKEPSLEDIVARMLRPTMFVVQSRLVGTPEQMKALLRDHLLYMIELEKVGLLFASGPFAGEDGAPDGSGLTVLRARDLEHAKVLAAADPMVTAGVRDFVIRQWTVNEGSIQVRIDLSDGTVSLSLPSVDGTRSEE